MQVIKLDEYRNRDVVSALRDLLAMAENGEVQGLVFVAKLGQAHRAGALGDYRLHPEQALPAATRMQRHLKRDTIA